ncbi:SsgA family sporulation/cell division regulator [Nonomuraea sp. H19]|uniref:SsgA family sporulation/cell division regulator n=1 Tax=Nonomuraea sp. H19 TaxID=3452206 RepID=UPI003F8B43C8
MSVILPADLPRYGLRLVAYAPNSDSGGVVTLDVPRDVLLKGLDELAICDDLKVQPSGEPMWTLWTLRWNPEEPLTFRVPTANLCGFLAETSKLVLPGTEESRIDWDGEIAELFEEAQEGDIP